MATTLRDTVEQLYLKHGSALLAYATAILESRSAAQDVLHQVFLKLLSEKVRMPDEPRPYLFAPCATPPLTIVAPDRAKLLSTTRWCPLMLHETEHLRLTI